jgi:hypothetical protein
VCWKKTKEEGNKLSYLILKTISRMVRLEKCDRKVFFSLLPQYLQWASAA